MNEVFVIGIAGGSASGKSTICRELKKRLTGLNVLQIHMDSYFKSAEERPKAEAPIVKKAYQDDNHPESFNLAKLKSDLKKAVQSKAYHVVIVEGLLTLWDLELCEMLSLRLFVDCRADERVVRRLKRNMTWGLTFDQVSDVYLDLVRYRHDEYVENTKWRSDLILNGSLSSGKDLEIITAYIRSILESD